MFKSSADAEIASVCVINQKKKQNKIGQIFSHGEIFSICVIISQSKTVRISMDFCCHYHIFTENCPQPKDISEIILAQARNLFS